MRAAVYYGPGDVRVEDRPEPAGTEDNLVAQVNCCAICGTDVKLATIGHHRAKPGQIIGHELVGHIVHVGEQVVGFAEGERITLDELPIGLGADGALAEFMAIPPQALAGGNVVKVPDQVPDEAAALSEPMSCAINAQQIRRAGQGLRRSPGNDLAALGATAVNTT